METHFLESARNLFRAIKKTGDGALAQVTLEGMTRVPGLDMNSIAVIVRHLNGNMLSRWTDFLSSDGEKPWRQRDLEFEQPEVTSREDVLRLWEEGWRCVFEAIDGLQAGDAMRTVTIRGQQHSVVEALHRQIQHYSYHVGQIVLLARLWSQEEWQTLSIARGKSSQYTPSGIHGEPPVR